MSDHLPRTFVLIDRAPSLVAAWTQCFSDHSEFEALEADFFSRPADAMVSPANSFGIMDGGLDLAIRDRLGFEVQREAQRVILERHHGELHVGQAEVIETKHEDWPHLVIAPTMRVPESVGRTLNAYLAFRATLLAVCRFNEAAGSRVIDSIVCPGLGTGIGGMDAQRCALQMRMAYRQVSGPARVPSYRQIHQTHQALVQS